MRRVLWVWIGVPMLVGVSVIAGAAWTQTPAAGAATFERLCARCHGADGQGGELGPGIAARLPLHSDEQLDTIIREGLPSRGMPPFDLEATERRRLVAHLRTLRARRSAGATAFQGRLGDGRTVEGILLNEGASDLQVLGSDRRLHLLRRDGAGLRRATSTRDWPTYHGRDDGNRFSDAVEITRATVGRLAPVWMATLPDANRLQVTPVVVDGVMYVTKANEVFALDAGSGRRIWHFARPRTKGLAGDAAAGINRGVAVAGDRIFLATDHAHLLALDRHSGDLLWDTTMADWRENYGATSAPLAVGSLIVSGISGGDEGVRGFVAAFDQASGREVWRFWTVPRRGEPGSETWSGSAIEHGCAATWLTGTFDAALNTLYWPTGNPCPDYDGSQRLGDNLYSDSILALDPATGRLKWHFQYTPHDLWDWDAQQPPVLVDADWEGRPRRLLLHANRNGFFYVLDRETGALLRATPFVERLTWARGIGADGRPIVAGGQAPTAAGTTVCPAVEGATNWFSTAFDARRGLYFVQALEKCTVYTRTPEQWQAGRSFYGGATRQVEGDPGKKVLKAIDVRTGSIRWVRPQVGPATSWGGVLATAGDLVFVAEDGGALMAVDPDSGEPLWQFQANVLWKASPMTYVFDGRQHIAIAAGSTIVAFALR
jgi:alcohol dehydrogenase (cytochrome c)